MAGVQNPCGGPTSDVYHPTTNPRGKFCNRNYDPSGMHLGYIYSTNLLNYKLVVYQDLLLNTS